MDFKRINPFAESMLTGNLTKFHSAYLVVLYYHLMMEKTSSHLRCLLVHWVYG